MARFRIPRRLPEPRLLVAIAVAALAVATVGCGGDDEEDAAPPPESRPTPSLVATTTVDGGSRPERALLTRVLGGMEGTTLEGVVIAPADARRETEGGKKAITITFTATGGATTRRQWDEWIVAGAYSRRLAAAGLPAEVDAADDRGGFTARPRVSGKPDPKPLAVSREAAIVRGIRNAARKSGAEVVSVEVHRPYAPAVAVTLAPQNPARFLRNRLRSLLRSLDAYRPRLEGIYIGVLDAERRLVLEWGSWTRNPAGSYWVRRDLARCSPIRQSEPSGEQPPPCPV